ncbi:MAG TPA: cbb3-type cytochrome c oxidase subunit II [Opitutaceae bacterium]|jgi:cytochrome c oxidase cbb3-type subunit 2|nr:cbb3-type cytochrome c oxidase subunit II [Opitutaceae bacterium]
MNRTALLFLGVFVSLAASWVGVVLVNQLSYGKLTPVVNLEEGLATPQPLPGLAQQGRLVYQDLGCASCHTQQVRRAGFGADEKRGWGGRQSVARDYIYEPIVLIGSRRLGPDLRNIGARKDGQQGREGREWFIQHLYDSQLTSPGSIMPSYRFLFETRKIVGQGSPKAIERLLPSSHQPMKGYEIVPTARGEALVSYLMSLKDTYAYPESKNVFVPKTPAAGGHQ